MALGSSGADGDGIAVCNPSAGCSSLCSLVTRSVWLVLGAVWWPDGEQVDVGLEIILIVTVSTLC